MQTEVGPSSFEHLALMPSLEELLDEGQHRSVLHNRSDKDESKFADMVH